MPAAGREDIVDVLLRVSEMACALPRLSEMDTNPLLADGLGDTIRVSLTEDPWHEIPVCREIVRRAEAFAALGAASSVQLPADLADPFSFVRRATETIEVSPKCLAGAGEVPRVVVRSVAGLADWQAAAKELLDAHAAQREVRAEGLLVRLDDVAQAASLRSLRKALGPSVPTLFVETSVAPADFPFDGSGSRLVVVKAFAAGDAAELKAWGEAIVKHDALLAVDLDGATLAALTKVLSAIPAGRLILTSSQPQDGLHATGTYRELVRCADVAQLEAPLWIRATVANATLIDPGFQSRLIEASILAGGLLVDGYGDFLSCETPATTAKSLTLAYDILQGARMRQTKTEYVACPSCGRTLFDIQSTTLKIKERTGHLKSVTIAVMGCIVNGPGEMADADFGYVGGAPGKINLYVGKTPVKFNIPQEEAVERLVDLIKEKGRWVDA